MTVQILRCDGCGKTSDEVALMVQFENHLGIPVHICDECVRVANDLVEDELYRREMTEDKR